MIYSKLITLVVSIVAFTCTIHAQQQFVYSQYCLNQFSINPAVAGSLQYNSLDVVYRQLWSGINEAPKMVSAAMQFAVHEMGIGGKIQSYSAGPFSNTGIELTYSHHIKIKPRDFTVSLGLSGLLNQYTIDKNKVTFEIPDDRVLAKSSQNLIAPDFNFGSFLYNDKFYVGLAIHQVLNRKVTMLNKKYLNHRQISHIFLNSGYSFSFLNDYKIEPSFLIKTIQMQLFQTDLNVLFKYKDFLNLGLSCRTSDAFIVMAGVGSKRISCNYAYDITFSNLRNYSRGSHELMITYKLISSKSKM